MAQGFLRYQASMRASEAFLSNGTRIGNILLFVCPAFPAIAFGLIFGNFMEWLFTGAGVDGAAYRSAQIGLFKFGLVASAISLPLSFMGANNFWALTPGRIDYRKVLSFGATHYDWRDVVKIETGCYVGKSTTTYEFLMTFRDGASIDVMEESPEQFWQAYPEIQSSLANSRYQFSGAGLIRCAGSAPRRWIEILSRPPTKPS